MPEFQTIRSDRRTLSLEIKPDGLLIVRAPLHLKEKFILDFIREKNEWIQKTREKILSRPASALPKSFREGEMFWYLGKEYALSFSEDAGKKLSLEAGFRLHPSSAGKARRHFLNWYREEAFYIFTDRCRIYGGLMQVRYQNISLSSAKRRWGSCSASGRLHFNWRLVMAPMAVIDYVVVHELAHLKELNHSPRFWNIVGSFYPQHKEMRAWLQKNQHRLTI